MAENVLVALVVPHGGTPSLRDSPQEGIYHGDIHSLRNPPREGSPHGCILMGAPCLKSSTVLMTNRKSTEKYFLKPCNCANSLRMRYIIPVRSLYTFSFSYSWTFHSEDLLVRSFTLQEVFHLMDSNLGRLEGILHLIPAPIFLCMCWYAHMHMPVCMCMYGGVHVYMCM